jgi:YHS domain-containing protein
MDHLKKFVVALCLATAFAFAAGVHATEPNQVNCPVMGGAASKKVYTDYQGKRIYFCCPPCIQQFNKDPDKYMKQFEKEGIILEDAPGARKE